MNLARVAAGIGGLGAALALAKGIQLRRDHLGRLPRWRPGDWPPVPAPTGDAVAAGGHPGSAQ